METLALKSIALLAIAWLCALLLRRRPAAERHLVWTAAWLGLLSLPVLAMALPALRLQAGSVFEPAPVLMRTTALAAGDVAAALASVSAPASKPAPPVHVNWRTSLLFVWACGVVLNLGQMFVSGLALWRMRRRARTVDDSGVEGLAESLGIAKRVEVLEIPRGGMPMTFGLRRAAVFLPEDAREWAQDRRRVVLLHELAHVKRGDWFTHLLARTVLSLYWWNPLAWLAWRESLKEQEKAADDVVLRAGARASDYAEHLLEIARMQAATSLGWAAVAMARRSHLEGRLVAILDTKQQRGARGRAGAWAAAALAIALVAPLAALRGQNAAGPVLPPDAEATIRLAKAQKDPASVDRAASAAERLHKYELAQKFVETGQQIRAETSGTNTVEYGKGLIKLGDLSRKLGTKGDAQGYYAKAVAVLGNTKEAAPALLVLGMDAMAKHDPDKAIEYFKQVMADDPEMTGTAMMWTALVRIGQHHPEQAEEMFRNALAVQDGRSGAAATTMELYANLLGAEMRSDEAAELRQQAKGIRAALGVAASTPRSSSVRKIGNGVSAPSVLSKVEPQYTDEAKLAEYQGTAVLAVEIGPDGLGHNIQIVRGLGFGLDDKAVEAIEQWHFRPGKLDGQPVPVLATIEVNFRLL